VNYSYSKLRSFEHCPLQFRLRYLDRIPAPAEGIEAFNGKFGGGKATVTAFAFVCGVLECASEEVRNQVVLRR